MMRRAGIVPTAKTRPTAQASKRPALWAAIIATVSVTAGAWRLWVIVVSMLADGTRQSDFNEQWLAASIGPRLGWSRIYDIALMQKLMFERWGRRDIFLNGPWVAGATVPLAHLPVHLSLAIWSIGLVAGTALAYLAIAPRFPAHVGLAHLGALVASGGFAVALYLGQPTLLAIGMLALAAVLLSSGRPWPAGAAVAVALALRPQMCFLMPLSFMAARSWRALLSTALVGGAIAAATVASMGPGVMSAYWTALAAAQHAGLGSTALELAFGQAAADVVRLVVAIVAVAMASRSREPELVVASGIACSLLAAPYIHPYELVALIVCFWLVLRVRTVRWEWILVAIAYMTTQAPVLSDWLTPVQGWVDLEAELLTLVIVGVAVVTRIRRAGPAQTIPSSQRASSVMRSGVQGGS